MIPKQKTITDCKLVKTVKELGAFIRLVRKSQGLTLAKVSAFTNVGMRFLSELERGKETIEFGKTLATLHNLGLEMIIQPRGYHPGYSISHTSDEIDE